MKARRNFARVPMVLLKIHLTFTLILKGISLITKDNRSNSFDSLVLTPNSNIDLKAGASFGIGGAFHYILPLADHLVATLEVQTILRSNAAHH